MTCWFQAFAFTCKLYRYNECANTLVALSSAPTAIKAAANCYCQLIVSQSDNNVKLIVLDRLNELKQNHRDVMQEMVMDILRAVASPNLVGLYKLHPVGLVANLEPEM